LMGALGEESVRALLRAQGVAFEPISDALFEVADLKIKGVNWYLDCKNYSDNTMGKFELMPDDYGYFTGFDSTHFKSRAVDKWRSIDASHGESSTGNRLIYLNLATSQTRLADYYQVQGHTLKRVHAFRDAHILIIPGAIDLSAPDTYHHTFTRLLSEMGDIL